MDEELIYLRDLDIGRRTFLVLWLGTCPFVFINTLGYATIAVCVVLAYSLLGMEAISLEIEEPFGRYVNGDFVSFKILYLFTLYNIDDPHMLLLQSNGTPQWVQYMIATP